MISIIVIITITLYSRDLGYKETMMMMMSMMKLPDDMFRLEMLQYLTVDDIVKLDNACMNHKYRNQLLEKISGVILIGDNENCMKASLFKWLGMRRIYLIKMKIVVSDYNFTPSSTMKNDYVDQFRYTQHVVMRGSIRDDMAIFIISHCPCLLSIEILSIYNYFISSSLHSQVTDHALQSIAEHCTGLQSLTLRSCREITDTGLIIISEYCPNLISLKIDNCDQITDTSIISISTHCTELQSLHLDSCPHLTDASIISISTYCTGLQSLTLSRCRLITDASIISISTHCSGLQSLHIENCHQITDASIISISTHCTGLQSIDLFKCDQITDTSIISISENCTGLKRFFVSYIKITDASLIAIAKNCTGLQSLHTHQCHGLSSDKLRCHHFKSLSELRAALLSIYPSLPI